MAQGGPQVVESRSRRVVTLPNAISALRLCMAVALPFVEPDWRLPLLIAGALSDWLDGLAAKLLRSRSAFGQLLDPIADKALFVSALLTLMFSGEIAWWHAILALMRDLVVLVVAATAILRRDWWAFGKMKPTVLGKITTVLVFAWLVALLVQWAPGARLPLLIAAAVSSAVTAAEYLRRFARELRAHS
jgi:phosphatidylglycerophosphate synthase